MKIKIKRSLFLTIYYLSPIIASIIYWVEEPLDSTDMLNNLIHRTGSILGIVSFIWMCFNITIAIKIKPIEKTFSLDGIIRFHTIMAAIVLLLMIIHYPMVRLGRDYSSFQIRTGTLGFMTFFILMVLALIFMSNKILKLKITRKLRFFASKKKLRHNVNKTFHNIMMLGVIIVFIHSIIAFTSRNSLLMSGVYSFFLFITSIGWIYHKLIRRFRKESDPYNHRRASWDTIISELITESDKDWALSLIKNNPSLYPCLQCGVCTDVCPVSEVTRGDYNPRRNILFSLLGYRNLLLKGDNIVTWGCTVCHTCDELCPQNIELTKTFAVLKNQSSIQGKNPDYIFEQIKAVFENAKAIPLQSAIERRREEMGLPVVVQPDLNEVQTLLRNLGIEKKLKLGE
ncbi:MAG: 4Fe-4S dicluster domain-containing protein [Promethearchaeota archaeon]|jgi:heterodisulfide reductase subunit C